MSLDPTDWSSIATGAEAGGNPVIPLVALLRERDCADDAAATWLHRGLTSQDVLDTALMLCARAALDRLADDLGRRSPRSPRWPTQHRQTIMVGRTLTQHAVPITFGLKAAGGCTACWTRWTGSSLCPQRLAGPVRRGGRDARRDRRAGR